MVSQHDDWMQASVIAWCQLLMRSFHRWTGRELVRAEGTVQEQARRLFEASFVVVSHGTEPDPILNYGNRAALELWEMTWDELQRTPSHRTAEQPNRAERASMLARTEADGYIADYRGVRISRSGRRFLIENALVWNVLDGDVRVGQAATFSRWTYLKPVDPGSEPS
jgi:MEKHLA domain-containing protein